MSTDTFHRNPPDIDAKFPGIPPGMCVYDGVAPGLEYIFVRHQSHVNMAADANLS
jgi:hypothetical protein